MDKPREARRSTTTMAASNGVTKRRQKISENSREQMHQEVATVRDRPGKKERDPESFNRSKRRRSERFAPRNERDVEEDSSDESQGDDDYHQRKSFSSGRIPRHAASLMVADEMIGVPVPRKARSACLKRSHDCRTSSGSHSCEVVSPSSSTLSVKERKIVNGSKSRIPKPPKSSGTVEDDLEIEIAEVLSGLKKQPHSSKRGDDSENSQKSSEVKGIKQLPAGVEICGLFTCKARLDSANIDKSTNGAKTSLVVASDIVDEKEPRVSEGPQLENNKDESHCISKLDIHLMVPPTLPSSSGRVSLLPLVSYYCKRDSALKSKEKITVKNEMNPEEVKQKKVDKRDWLNLDIEGPNQETDRDSNLRLQNLDWSQPQQAKSAPHSSVLPLPVAVASWPSGVPPQGHVALIQTGKPVDESNGSSKLVQGAPISASQPRPKRCATHFFIARNIQLHKHFLKTNHLPTPNKGSVYLKGGDLRPTAGNPSLHGSSPILSLNSQPHVRNGDNISAPNVKASESGHFASTRQNKPQPPPASISVVPAPAFIYPANHHLQPVMVPSKSSRPTKSPHLAVGLASANFSHPSSSASEVSSPYLTVIPNNAYSFQLSSTIRGGTPSQAVPFYNGSFYSPQMFQQPPQPLQRQSQAQRESKASSCSSSSHRQPQVSVNSLSSQANVQQHRQMSQKFEVAGVNTDSRGSHTQKGGPFGQIMAAPVQPQNFSMSFASIASSAPPATLNFSSNGYHISTPPGVAHQKNHQSSEAKTGGGSCSSNAEDPKKNLQGKPQGMMNGHTLVFDNPSRTLNFVSGLWPPPAATAINGDPSVFTQHLTQRQQQSGRSKMMMTHSQADSVSATSSQWKNPATSSSLTSCTSLNLKQFQSQQQIRTHGQTQISFAAPTNPQPSQGKQGRSGGSSPSVTGSASHGKPANSKVSNSKALLLSPVPLSQEHTENPASGSTQKTSPVCGRTVPPIITSCPGHLSELKY